MGYQEQYFHALLSKYEQIHADQQCDVGGDSSEEEASTQMTVKDMLGAYFLHIVISFACVIGAMLCPCQKMVGGDNAEDDYLHMDAETSDTDKESSLSRKAGLN